MTADSPANRRAEPRLPVHFEVDCTSGDTFLFAHITDISSMGIFISTDKPLPVGTVLQLGFTPRAGAGEGAPQRLELTGEVVWNTTGQVAPDKPGMGVRFHHAAPKTRSRLLEFVRAIAYLDVTTDIKS
ncbi:TIGR02266 family protein [Nannocystis punicea]|uniref:TIGR02266 family protein n=1 Tax=Nannocystis punicea TaxID=2995304 RepID=A0ABY7H9Z7_9BACT|nr:TIGR02266 family protein [Nannocystis poenicansa]WAS96096.1 TIGR02266 family protein [Nannocystis poenicansa]